MIGLLLVFVLVWSVQMAYYMLARSHSYVLSKGKPVYKPISIIVCARNEAGNLQKHIPHWLQQSVFLNQDFRRWNTPVKAESEHRGDHLSTGSETGTSFEARGHNLPSELLIIDDYSTDATAEVVRSFCGPGSPISLLRPPQPTRPGKKDALSYGISQARYDFLLLTDADCRPATKQWAELMTAPLMTGASVVVGHGAYQSHTSSFLARWQAFTAEYHGLQYRSLTRQGWSLLGVGRNLAYTKDFFYARSGMDTHAQLAGGDDDLLLQTRPDSFDKAGSALVKNHAGRPAEVYKNEKYSVVDAPDTWTFSEPAGTWREYASRKQRHFSIGRHYPARSKWILTGLAMSHGLFYLLGFLLLFTPWRWWALLAYVLRMIAVWRAYKRPASLWPIYDAILCFYLLWQTSLTILTRPRKVWTDRSKL